MLDIARIRAISLDLDDTLWPIWPTIERAEKVLHHWLATNAPVTSALYASPAALREIRDEVALARPELKNDMSSVRRESIRLALHRAGENPLLAEAAFDVFFAQRHRVTLFDDALPSLQFLSARLPLVSVSNGNANLELIGLAPYFRASLSAGEFGFGKPDPRIFHAAAEAVNFRPHELLHVGDDATLDALGALDAGMQVAWINRSDSRWPHPTQAPVTLVTLTQLCELFE